MDLDVLAQDHAHNVNIIQAFILLLEKKTPKNMAFLNTSRLLIEQVIKMQAK